MPEHKKLINTIKGINSHINNNIYLLNIDDGIIASTTKNDLNKYLCSDHCVVGIEDVIHGDLELVYGMVLDPLNLPFELSKEQIDDRSILLLSSDDCHSEIIEIEECGDLQETVTYIENLIKNVKYCEHNIEDFAIIVGEKIELSIQIMQRGIPLDPGVLEVFEMGE